MLILVIGLLVWVAAHFFKRLMPEQRAAMGDKGKGLVAVGVILSLVLMIYGYRAAAFVPVWTPPAMLTGINNLLMVFAFYVYGASAAKPAKVWIGTKLRHPQLTAVKIWAVAHLLVNGDVASILLFGGMLAWAVASVILINKAEGPWTPPPQAPARKEYVLIGITLVLVIIVSTVHILLGVNPFGG
ncbi:NnrU family protein [Algirhabdus cladophorae]|uniref:NnrU family protein n=1 Tax=Algirhabdus cladophorae TaxID=3377108 RepID=UPI003B845DE9